MLPEQGSIHDEIMGLECGVQVRLTLDIGIDRQGLNPGPHLILRLGLGVEIPMLIDCRSPGMALGVDVEMPFIKLFTLDDMHVMP